MKFFAAAAAIALASSSAVSAEPCQATQLTAGLSTLIAPATACQTATEYTIIIATALPTADQVKKICEKCTDLITAAKAVTFPTCTLDIGGKPTGIDELFKSIAGQCGGAGAAGAANATAANSTTTAPSATTIAPAATTMKPAGSTAGSMSTGSKSGSEEVKAPAAATSQPAATTAAPKSAGVTATLGAAVAVACSIAAFVL